MSIDARNGKTYGPLPCTPLVSNTTDGPRCAWRNSRTITSTTPAISNVTPIRVITAIFVTPNDEIATHTAMQIDPRMIAFRAPSWEVGEESVPTSWNPLHTAGSTVWSAIAI